MKILTQEEEQAHYNETLKGGAIGGFGGLAVGSLGLWAAGRQYPVIRSVTIPFRVFLVASVGTFASIVTADTYSRRFEAARHGNYNYRDTSATTAAEIASAKPWTQRTRHWITEHRYPLLIVSWVASMGTALALVRRNPYLSTTQKLVQARVYAQSFTLAALLGSFAFEASDGARGTGRWETVKYLDPNDPEHKRVLERRVHHERYKGEDQWMDMIEAEERRLKEREAAVKNQVEKDENKGKLEKHHDKPNHKEHHDRSKKQKDN